MKTYNVCWSGGVDSTFIVTQLSQFPIVIHPFYIKGQTFRLSEPQELDAIASIRDLLLNDPRTKAEILPPEIVEKNDLRIKDHEIVKAHRRIYMRNLQTYKTRHGGTLPAAGSNQIYMEITFISPQYVSCASIAKCLGKSVEIGFTCDDYENNIEAFQSCSMSVLEDRNTDRKISVFNEEQTDKDMYTLFRDIRFPIVGQGMHKRDIWRWYSDHGYTQVRSKTIFCHTPVMHEDGLWEPCGICAPCMEAIHSGVVEPFTEAGLARYRDYEENHEKEPERFRLKGF